MAIKKAIVDFIKNNRDKLNIQIDALSWPEKYGFNLYDFQFQFTVDSKVFTGRGCDSDKEIALVKAFAEGIERYIVNYYNLDTSNGLAVHVNLDDAHKNAKNELIERDSFFLHYLTNTKFASSARNSESNLIQKTKDLLNKNNVEMHQLIMADNCVCVVFDGENAKKYKFGVIIGTSCSDNIELAAQKATIECLQNYIDFIENEGKTFDVGTTLNPTIYEHFLNGLSLGYGMYFKKNFVGNSKTRKFAIDEILFKSYAVPAPFDELDLFACRAYSSNAQELYFGQTTEKKINIKRLGQFLERDLSFLDINKVMHAFY